MKKTIRKQIITIFVFLLLSFGSLFFVTWIGQMAYDNTSIELQEQNISTRVGEIVDLIEKSINFGKELSNYYGMDEVLSDVVSIRNGKLKAVVLDEKGEVLYTSLEKSKENIAVLADIYSKEYQEKIAETGASSLKRSMIELESRHSLVFPVKKDENILNGYLLVIYEKDALLEKNSHTDIYMVFFGIWIGISFFLTLFSVFMDQEKADKWYIRFLPAMVIMTGIFAYIVFLYCNYQAKYDAMINQNAQETAVYIQSSVNDLVEKGMPPEYTGQVGSYLDNVVAENEAIGSIYIVKAYYDTSENIENTDSNIIRLPIAGGEAFIDISVSQSFILKQMRLISLTFGAIFIICLMITYELTYLAEIISDRTDHQTRQEPGKSGKLVGTQIKLLSFLAYTAIYISMPYAAVIMRSWDADVFGFSKAFSASFPLTVELFSVMLFSVFIQKIFSDTHMERIAFFAFSFLIIGNLACMRVTSPYVLIGLRAFCGIGFAFLKYWLNAFVAAGSEDGMQIRENFARLNAGLLGGITVGASLGSVLAQSFGYLYNYLFTAVLVGVVLALALMVVPWKKLNKSREDTLEKVAASPIKFKELLKRPGVMRAILFGDVPLNIGLMYVVAFLPVYVSAVGQSAVVTSYAYLVNGLAGVYGGVILISALKRISPRASSSMALLIGAAGILILVAGKNAWVILASAGIMGLFDGYGTPTITTFFTGLPQVRGADTASMLTVYSSVGSAVQIICPMLYNLLIQPDGSVLYLFIFGIIFAAVGVLFPWLFKEKKTGGANV